MVRTHRSAHMTKHSKTQVAGNAGINCFQHPCRAFLWIDARVSMSYQLVNASLAPCTTRIWRTWASQKVLSQILRNSTSEQGQCHKHVAQTVSSYSDQGFTDCRLLVSIVSIRSVRRVPLREHSSFRIRRSRTGRILGVRTLDKTTAISTTVSIAPVRALHQMGRISSESSRP